MKFITAAVVIATVAGYSSLASAQDAAKVKPFDQIQTTAPRAPFDQLQDSAPKSDQGPMMKAGAPFDQLQD